MNERDKELYQQATGKEWAYDFDINTAEKFADLIRADEREACAQVCDFEWGTGAEKDAGIMFAAVIRARGNT
jgi:hypothetical protein